ncbi:hypothetical protein Asulf_01559 [Archaeoglobus sulfaticallidus PM70-1]|uniref:Peroxiredoxin n=1 Tax=Archaeoglobus sulfaticallidus PM70-1 TaxID=387631 RepID=N0BLW4_9EURY|nr:hypothetical protein [Archaeoglobus sulfaticallidus]AGK61536.1 hypothetical protein Asulf_01559 [Archaeoglobus sulfaticallidus PM70-1]
MHGIIIHSGDWDRIYHAFNIASVYGSSDQEVVVLLTYWALRTAIESAKEVGVKDGEKEEILRNGISRGVIKRLEDMIKLAKSTGNVRIGVCPVSLSLLGYEEKDLPDWVDEVSSLFDALSMENVIFI